MKDSDAETALIIMMWEIFGVDVDTEIMTVRGHNAHIVK